MKEQNIEQLFKDGLSNLEADVPQGVWTNIQQGLHVPVNAPVSSVAAKSAGIIGKMGLKSLLIISAASITVVSSIFYFTTDKSENKKAATVIVPVKAEPIIISSENLQTEKTAPLLISENKNPDAKHKAISSEVKPSELQIAETPQSTVEKEIVPAAQPSLQSSQNSHPQENGFKNNSTVDKPASVAENNIDVLNSPHNNPQTIVEPDPVFDAIENHLSANASGEKALPNSFSPNGDGTNDKFSITTSGLKSLEVVIYDMKGKKIYSLNSFNISWDGMLSNGRDAEAGNYFYTVYAETTDGKICIAKSPLTLFRNRQN